MNNLWNIVSTPIKQYKTNTNFLTNNNSMSILPLYYATANMRLEIFEGVWQNKIDEKS